jgi:hypothetical protein
VGGIDLRDVIRRWVRGFHAALYREPLAAHREFQTFPPWAEAQETERGFQLVQVPEIVPDLVAALKRNRAVGSLDRIVCRQGQCIYECVWIQADRGQWFCVYGIKIYDWTRLGDTAAFGSRGCVGSYRRPEGGPLPRAATGTDLDFRIENAETLDPFGR